MAGLKGEKVAVISSRERANSLHLEFIGLKLKKKTENWGIGKRKSEWMFLNADLKVHKITINN